MTLEIPEIDQSLDTILNLGETFKKTKLLDAGSFGKVFLMTSESGKQIAAKTIRTENRWASGEAQKEIHVMAKLNHSHIVQFLGYRLNDGIYTILMECVGGNLTTVDFFFDDEKRIVFGQLLGAVEYMHGQGFAHCDLKPENVLVKNTAHVKICDFGGATRIQFDAYGRELPQAGMVGSRSYEAPLKIRQKPSKASKDDIWSLGLILYWLFAEDLPWYVAIEEEDAHFRRWTEGIAPPTFELLFPEVVEVLYWALSMDEYMRPAAKELSKFAYCKSKMTLPPPPGLGFSMALPSGLPVSKMASPPGLVPPSPMAPPPGFEHLKPKNLL